MKACILALLVCIATPAIAGSALWYGPTIAAGEKSHAADFGVFRHFKPHKTFFLLGAKAGHRWGYGPYLTTSYKTTYFAFDWGATWVNDRPKTTIVGFLKLIPIVDFYWRGTWLEGEYEREIGGAITLVVPDDWPKLLR